MVNLNRNNSNWSFEERRKINENWEILERQSNATTSGNNGLKQEVEELKVAVNQNTNRSTNALQTANQAKAESASVYPLASEANQKSDQATVIANEAKTTAEGIDGKADQANETANNALQVANEANSKSDGANLVANDAKDTAETIQNQFNQVVAEAGSNNPEVVQARGDFDNLSVRLDTQNELINQRLIDDRIKLESSEINVKMPFHGLNPCACDGVTDDYENLQAIVDYAFDNGITDVYIPGKCLITKPLYLWGGSRYVDNGVKLRGLKVNASALIKVGNATPNDGSRYSDVNAAIILANRDKVTNITYRQEIENLRIDANSSDYGIYANTLCAELNVEKVTISAGICFQTVGDMWQSSFRDLLLYPRTKGFSMLSSGTSNLIERSFVYGANTIGWELRGDYSFANNLACDESTGTAYSFSFSTWIINGLGCESPNITNVISTSQSQVTINSIGILQVVTPGARIFNIGNDSTVSVNGGSIGNSALPAQRDAFLVDKGTTNVKFSISNVRFFDTFLRKTTSVGRTYVNYTTPQSTEIATRQGGKLPFIGIDRHLNDLKVDFHNAQPAVNGKAIFLDCDNFPTRGRGNADLSYETKAAIGDIFINNDPGTIGGLGYITAGASGENLFLRDNIFLKIPIIHSGTTANRPISYLTVGQQYYDTTLGTYIYHSGSNVWRKIKDDTIV